MVQYVHCSTGEQTDVQPLLIHTDERDEAYKQNVARQLKNRNGTSRVIFIDSFLQPQYPKDNYMVFTIELAIEALSTQRFALRLNEGCRELCQHERPDFYPNGFQWKREFPVAFQPLRHFNQAGTRAKVAHTTHTHASLQV